ncbi:MAG: hypothetical protein JWP47_2530 [Polaromonas sp.]|jgi:hypothetical protein|nr:hypothetical protein [Polaromonas sp.]
MSAMQHQPDFSPAADRNKQPILDMLLRVLAPQGSALEIASGTGQHAAWFAAGLPGWAWQPTEVQPEALASILAWTRSQGLANVRPPMLLDVASPDSWPADAQFDLVYCANLIHIAPWPVCAALMRASARLLAARGKLITYGPYLESDIATSEGNIAFDASLKQRNPAWGLRALDEVAQEAASAGLRLAGRHALPANNLLLVWERAEH